MRVAPDGTISFNGINNRYNSFRIDGVINNDAYGLADNGFNGGQAGTQPVSMETVEQLQISVAPFDVRQSGFTGGAVNAITRSGTNDFHGSVYGFGNNRHLIGRSYRMRNGASANSSFTSRWQSSNVPATRSGWMLPPRAVIWHSCRRLIFPSG